MKRFSLLIVLFAVHFNSVASITEVEKRELCIKVLHDLKVRIDSVIEVVPDSFDFLTEGRVDEESLRLLYPHLSNSDYPTVERGLSFQFFPQLIDEEYHANMSHNWHYLDLGLLWNWSWSGSRGFNFVSQQMVMLQLKKACYPISNAEHRLAQPFLEKQPKNGRVLVGNKKLSLNIAIVEDSVIEISAISNTVDIFSISTFFDFQYIVDDSIFNHQIPTVFLVRVNFKKTNPFVKVHPLKSTKIQLIYPPLSNMEGHRIRLIATFRQTSWTDYGPTIVDGSPIHHNIKDAWTGTVISNEIYIPQVDKDE